MTMDEFKTKPWGKWLVYAMIAICAACGLVWAKKLFWPVAGPAVGYQTATPAKGMSDPPTEEVMPVVPLKVYSKEKAVKKMELPAEIAADPKSALLSTARVAPSEGGYTTATVLDTTTGQSTTIVREEQRPLLGFGGDGGIGVRGGISMPGGITGTVYIRQKLIRIGTVQMSAYGEVTGSETRSVEARAMAEVELWRWK